MLRGESDIGCDAGRRVGRAGPGYATRMAFAESDMHVAGSRATGGVDPRPHTADGLSTTGVERTGEFVGRVAGDDAGYAGETGAEVRAEAQRQGRTGMAQHP
jgi:hypothetical protein